MTYSQSGFELKNTSGRNAKLWLSKIGDIPIHYHPESPDEVDIKEVISKKGQPATGSSRSASKPTRLSCPRN